MLVPKKYDKSKPPKTISEVNKIYTKVEIINIDFVDTISMSVGLTVAISMRWQDSALKYENAKDPQMEIAKNIPEKERESIWLPLNELVFDNAILGQTEREEFYTLQVLVKADAEKMLPNVPREALVYPGMGNFLLMKQTMKLKYNCNFDMIRFPFDSQTCDFYISINTKHNRSSGKNEISLEEEENEPISYNGPTTLNEFRIIELTSRSQDNDTKTSFIYTIRFQRLSAQTLLKTFMQSFFLWILAFLTFFIEVHNFSDRFMGSVTALLVLVNLLSSLEYSLPKTSDFKLIDLWFNWFIVNILTVTITHVYVNFLLVKKDKDSMASSPQKHNDICKAVYLILNVGFLAAYFFVSCII